MQSSAQDFQTACERYVQNFTTNNSPIKHIMSHPFLNYDTARRKANTIVAIVNVYLINIQQQHIIQSY